MISTFPSVAVLPSPGNVVARAFNRFTTAWLGPVLQQGRAGFLNLTGYLSRWSFRTLIKPLQKSLSVLRILLSPTPLLAVAALHAVNLAEDQKHEEPKSRES